MTSIVVCPSPILYPFYQQESDTVVVVDILRASTTICVALQNGAHSVIPVASLDEARSYKTKGFLVGAERNAKRCDFADFGNSPFDYSSDAVSGKDVVFTTTNGTQAIDIASGCRCLYVGAFVNIEALANKLVGAKRIVVVCAGWNNRINIEDTLFAGALIEQMSDRGEVDFSADSAQMALLLWQSSANDVMAVVGKSEHYARLKANGVEHETAYCLKQNTVPVVPFYTDGRLIIKS